MLNFEDGSTIIKEGDPGDLLYIIKEGKAKVAYSGQTRQLGHGEYFGEQALLYNCVRTATVTADGDVVCLSLSRIDLENIFADKF